MRRDRRCQVHEGDTRTLSVVRQVACLDTLVPVVSSWLVDAEVVDRSALGGRPKRRR